MISDDETWTLVRDHLSLVSRVVARFRNARVSPSDLRAEGVLGLVEAAFRFDPALDAKASDYDLVRVAPALRDIDTPSHD